MFCPKCGVKIEPGIKFCPYCGAKLPNQAAKDIIGQNGNEPKSNSANSQPGGRILNAQKKSKAGMRTSKKTFPYLILTAFCAVLGFFAIKMIGNSSAVTGTYAYISDSHIEVFTDLAKCEKTAKQIDQSIYNDVINGNLLAFSADEKYVYFLNRYDDHRNVGTLCQAELKKLKKDPDKNSEYIKSIASDVMSFEILENGMVIYLTSNRDLYTYSNGESYLMINSAYGYKYIGKSRLLIFKDTLNKDEIHYPYTYADPFEIYYVDMNAPRDVSLIEKQARVMSYKNIINNEDEFEKNYYDYAEIVNISADSNSIFFLGLGAGSCNLYEFGIDQEPTIIVEGVWLAQGNNGNIYYLKEMSDIELDIDILMPFPHILYKYESGESIQLDDMVLAFGISPIDNILFYTKYTPELESRIRVQYEESNGTEVYINTNRILRTEDDSIIEISEAVISQYVNKVSRVSASVDNIIYIQMDGDIYELPIENNSIVNEMTLVADDAKLYGAFGDAIYFVDDLYTETPTVEKRYGNLYCIRNGQKQLIANNILCDDIFIYEDNYVIATRDYIPRFGYQAVVFKPDGDEIILGDAVKHITRVDENTLCCVGAMNADCNDEDIDVYDLGTGWFWSAKEMEATNLNLYQYIAYDYGFDEAPLLIG